MSRAVRHADRREPLKAYLSGLLLPGERKSVEPMAAKLDPLHVQARHQSLHHFVSQAPWAERDLLRVARDYALAAFERHAPVAAWVVDDTAIPKKGSHSVGVTHQYCGVLGKSANCQVAVTVSLVNAVLSVPGGFRLYLPKEWAQDRERRRAAGVPPEVEFQTKGMIALAEIDELLAEEVPAAPVVADAGYGASTEFRDALTERGLSYMVGILPDTGLWPPGEEPLPPNPWKGQGRPPKLLRRTDNRRPVLARELAQGLPRQAWRKVRWREGTKGMMSSRFAALRVRVAHRDYERTQSREPEWFLVEWPTSSKEPSRYWLSTVAEEVALEELVRLAMIRWRIERDFQELKDELGLDHYEGRGWRGFHHHGALCIAAYAFLAAERARLSPPAPLAFLRPARLPKDFRPRGSPAT
ncbi:MAG TPA: IS701 family transposase [Thermoanaerobaculia bacterium]|nr:IS701 family transposase [Thermoanaerobaculia bacterium]